MHLRDSGTASVMRRRATGPYALMQRRSVAAFVPDRGRAGVPFRMNGFGASSLMQSASAAYTGAAVGASLTGATSVISAVAGMATAGSFVPVIGTAIGAIIGLVASGVFNHRVDPEVGNFDNAVALYHQNPQSVLNIADKYLVLAGLFDLEPSQIKGNIPMYRKYGRMGEFAFVSDMANLIYQAAQNGRITNNDTVQTVFNNVVQPWIASWGLGAMQDANGDMINLIILGLVAEYITGLWKTRWYARAGDMPAWHIPDFALPGIQQAAVTQATASPTPSPVAMAANNTPAFQTIGTTDTGQPLYADSSGLIYVSRTTSTSSYMALYTGNAVISGRTVHVSQGNVDTTVAGAAQQPQVITLPSAMITGSAPVAAAASTPVAAAAGSSPVAMPVQYTSFPSYMPSPVTAASPLIATSSAAFSTQEEIMLIAGGLLLFLLLRRRQPAGSAA